MQRTQSFALLLSRMQWCLQGSPGLPCRQECLGDSHTPLHFTQHMNMDSALILALRSDGNDSTLRLSDFRSWVMSR